MEEASIFHEIPEQLNTPTSAVRASCSTRPECGIISISPPDGRIVFLKIWNAKYIHSSCWKAAGSVGICSEMSRSAPPYEVGIFHINRPFWLSYRDIRGYLKENLVRGEMVEIYYRQAENRWTAGTLPPFGVEMLETPDSSQYFIKGAPEMFLALAAF